jgi:hypothetical protein
LRALACRPQEGEDAVSRDCFLLEGEDVVPADTCHDFPILDDVVSFTGDFISTSTRAAEIIDAFGRGADPGELGSWSRL